MPVGPLSPEEEELARDASVGTPRDQTDGETTVRFSLTLFTSLSSLHSLLLPLLPLLPVCLGLPPLHSPRDSVSLFSLSHLPSPSPFLFSCPILRALSHLSPFYPPSPLHHLFPSLPPLPLFTALSLPYTSTRCTVELLLRPWDSVGLSPAATQLPRRSKPSQAEDRPSALAMINMSASSEKSIVCPMCSNEYKARVRNTLIGPSHCVLRHIVPRR